MDSNYWTMSFTIFAKPEDEEDEEDLNLEESEGEEIEVQNSIRITAKVYEVEKNDNEEILDCPKKVFIHFAKTEKNGNTALFGQTLRELMKFDGGQDNIGMSMFVDKSL